MLVKIVQWDPGIISKNAVEPMNNSKNKLNNSKNKLNNKIS